MKRDEITNLAREAGFVGMDARHGALSRFAAIVAAAEREACAKLCEAPRGLDDALRHHSWWECAEAIRARGGKGQS